MSHSTQACPSVLTRLAGALASQLLSASWPCAPPAAVWVSGWQCAEGRGSALPSTASPQLRNDPGGGPALLRPQSRGAGRRERAAVAWAAARGQRRAGRGCGRAGPAPGSHCRHRRLGRGSRAPGRLGRAPPRPAPARPGRPCRKGAPPATPEPERSGIRAGTGTRAGVEPEREPELEPKLEPAVRRTERSEAAKPSKGRGAGGGAGEGRGGGPGPLPRALRRPQRTHTPRGHSTLTRGGTAARFERDPPSPADPCPDPRAPGRATGTRADRGCP
ncbi:unnamed protein product [Rangifer tarandus platyrhynchus]|uniref:Uncharacterized protein n=2 Tax=Rangifer tarandus platyrhynchus TaxID=3082113 RepID=A0ACB0E9L7_RANTA|nr:unnamed protein product [Rangifer tarandus platyrhynchus]CAI9697081.1 unnamed protein product [Rangifer tarandus platyrhynchus]